MAVEQQAEEDTGGTHMVLLVVLRDALCGAREASDGSPRCPWGMRMAIGAV